MCTKRPIRRKVVAPKQNLCDLCKLLVNFLKPYVDSNSTEVSEIAQLECHLYIHVHGHVSNMHGGM